jgi:serine/threonine-protein kinase
LALDHAHAHAADSQGRLLRVLHRDISPSNVLLDRSGQFKLSDFGVARALAQGDPVRTRHLVGKPSYVAPEVLQDRAVDERADLWSLGVVLYEALTNHRPFKRSSDAATLLAVIEADLPPLALKRPGLSPAWQVFFDRCVAKDPDARFASAEDVHSALLALQAIEGRASASEIAALLGFGDEELPLEHTDDAAVARP